MPALTAQASIDIRAPARTVHDVLVDFHTWPHWSPWLYLEPEAVVTYRGEKGQTGHGYDWDGNKVGAGGMTLTAAGEERIECDLQFLKPFKSTASVCFNLEEVSPGETTVTWFMDSRLPFFMFFMKDTLNGMIRSDYRRGLALLKDHIELGEVPSHSEFVGTVSLDGCHYIGYRENSGMVQLPDSVQISLEKVIQAGRDGRFPTPDTSVAPPLCFHDRMDYKRDTCTYTVALPTQERVSVEAPLLSAHRPACSALKVVHTGSYRHLGNAWAMLISESRHQKLKASKTVSPFERHVRAASVTPSQLPFTELYLPLRE